jgi:hypothetical protein
MLQLSPCGQSSLQPEQLSICKHVLELRGFVAQASIPGTGVGWPAVITNRLVETGCEVLRRCLHCFQRQSVAMEGNASKCGAVTRLGVHG